MIEAQLPRELISELKISLLNGAQVPECRGTL